MTETEAHRRARATDAAAFRDPGVAAAYRHRPPYPQPLIDALAAAVIGPERRVIDLGCGTGDIARPLAASVGHVDAVDFSAEMIAVGRTLVGGDSPKISWHQSPCERFDFNPPYGLAVTAESLHWMDLEALFSRLTPSLEPGALLALVSRTEETPWSAGYLDIAKRYSMSLSYGPRDLVGELAEAGLARLDRQLTFGTSRYSQTVEDYVELQHSRASFSRSRMTAEASEAFDGELRLLLGAFAKEGILTYGFVASVTFLRP